MRDTCVLDTFPVSAFNTRGYFHVFIELIVRVTDKVFEDTLKFVFAFSLKCRRGKFTGKQTENKPSILPVTSSVKQ